MNPYSHLAIARQLEKEIKPAVRVDYFWGAVAPDIRYVAGRRRHTTHIRPERILKFFSKFPHLDSFIRGYLIHCLTDDVDLDSLVEQRVLLQPIMYGVSGRFFPVLIEAFYLERMPVKIEFSGTPNEMLRELGIEDRHSEAFAGIIRPFASAPSLDSGFEFLRVLRKGDARVERYIRSAKLLNKNNLLKPILFAMADLNKLNLQILGQVREAEAFKRVCKSVGSTLRPAH